MLLLASVATLVGCVLLLHVAAGLWCVGPTRLRGDRSLAARLREVGPYLAGLGVVLGVNRVVRELVPELSWVVGWNVTGLIYRIEGGSVAVLQSVATPWLTALLAAAYLVGYVFLLTFPFVAYLTLPEATTLKRVAVAYAANYTLGLVCYLLFIAYGPRNLVPGTVEPLLYEAFPRAQLLTSQVNTNTNAFPSLHTSLSVTAAAFAWRTRRRYPRWAAVAVPLAAGVVVSTMYLGIHWAMDVIAGALLAAVSVALADRLVERA
ncbi:phosphatase PAP2 family protein [Halorarius halobius]|uniref:phosphatase PAP2 family protein n=1 Tax=Halorarius halobius TaxID=2962671 RepID=UPI0020CFE4B9|nr:phosphatase PAP2 family protein [Halorarius halobius]